MNEHHIPPVVIKYAMARIREFAESKGEQYLREVFNEIAPKVPYDEEYYEMYKKFVNELIQCYTYEYTDDEIIRMAFCPPDELEDAIVYERIYEHSYKTREINVLEFPILVAAVRTFLNELRGVIKNVCVALNAGYIA